MGCYYVYIVRNVGEREGFSCFMFGGMYSESIQACEVVCMVSMYDVMIYINNMIYIYAIIIII